MSEYSAGHGQYCFALRGAGEALTPLASFVIIMLSVGDFRCYQLLSVCGPQAELGLGGDFNVMTAVCVIVTSVLHTVLSLCGFLLQRSDMPKHTHIH